MTIDLRKLNQLVVAARLGSLSRAAEALHLSQPAISRNIALMEEQLGVRVFHRTPQGLQLSEAGKVAIHQAEALLEQAKIFDHNWELYRKGESGRLRFGVWSLVGSVLLPDVLRHMAIQRPRLKLWAFVNDHPALLDSLYSRESEFLVCRGDQVPPAPELLSEYLGDIHFSAYVRRGHPLAAREQVTDEDITRYTILSGQDPANVPEHFADCGIFFCENSDVMRHVVLNTDSIWVVPSRLAEQEVRAGRLVKLPHSSPQTPERSSMAVHLIRLKGYELTPAAEYVVSYLRSSAFRSGAAGTRGDRPTTS